MGRWAPPLYAPVCKAEAKGPHLFGSPLFVLSFRTGLYPIDPSEWNERDTVH